MEVVAFANVSAELRREADLYVSGYLIPNLQGSIGDAKWGEIGSRVRGVCYSYSHDRSFGFLRFLKEIKPGLWNIDTRKDNSPYASAFAHESEFPSEVEIARLPSRQYVFEFTLISSDRGLQAKDLTLSRHSGTKKPAPGRVPGPQVEPPAVAKPDVGGEPGVPGIPVLPT